MKLDKPAGIAQFVVLVLTVAALVLIFSPHEDRGTGLAPVGRRIAMPDVTMPDLQGGNWSLSEHRGRVVLVNFWATWCPPCRREIPALMRLAKSRQGLDIAGIATDNGDAVIRRFVKAAGVTYPILLPPASSVLVEAMESLPTTFLVDREGKIAKRYIGEISERMVRADVDLLLAERL